MAYNHSATINSRYWQYDGNTAGGGGIYLVNGHNTRFGSGLAMWQQEVKNFFLDNARMYLRDYRANGLRFDAVQFIQTDAIEYIVTAQRREFPDKYLIAEYNPSDQESAAAATCTRLAMFRCRAEYRGVLSGTRAQHDWTGIIAHPH